MAAVSVHRQGMRREGVRGPKRWRASLADGAGEWVDGRYGRVEDEGDAGCRVESGTLVALWSAAANAAGADALDCLDESRAGAGTSLPEELRRRECGNRTL